MSIIHFSFFFYFARDKQWHSRDIGKIKNKDSPMGSSDNGSTRYWPPGSLHTLGTSGHNQQ